ncbi:hypothetical protein AN958_07205 [Leucoagaricus sp. SymC.cos]|nr:hypothetical protein AN958_07205 [Leucoagaricus sp. SymC.cos]
MSVVGGPYRPKNCCSALDMDELPALFISRKLRQSAPSMHYEKERFSVLHHPALQGVVRANTYTSFEERTLVAVMEKIAGRRMNPAEQYYLILWTGQNRHLIASNLFNKEFVHYPLFPPLAINYDPGGERMPTDSVEQEDSLKWIKKWSRLHRKGAITTKQLHQALKRWDTLSPEEKWTFRESHLKHQKK